MTLQDILFGKPEAIDDTPPTTADVEKAMALPCLQGPHDAQPTHTLASLVQGYDRAIVVFIRHNHCDMCVRYVRALAEQAPLKQVATTSEEETGGDKARRVKVLIIGHGSHEGITHYRKISDCPFDMYVDEEKQLYTALGLTRRFLGKVREEKPSYMGPGGAAGSVVTSLKEMAMSGSLAWKGGEFSLLGGEFVFDKDKKPIFVHRMRDTGDHTDADKLAEYANIA